MAMLCELTGEFTKCGAQWQTLATKRACSFDNLHSVGRSLNGSHRN